MPDLGTCLSHGVLKRAATQASLPNNHSQIHLVKSPKH